MDRLRRSFRDSFRRRKDRVPESSKPHQWQADEEAVRSATCSFAVKYLGCVEVFESRGMQVCEEALKVLRNSRRRPVRGMLHVSGDGLRVVDDETKGLIVDQTIEKVSFCAPDRNHERGFSYICRDGTTRRWMCHGFLACKELGERLSHAVGCAFAVCLERKQRRDKECGVTMTFDVQNSTFTRTGSFRTQTMTERFMNNERSVDTPSAMVPPQQKPFNPFAIERPHATPSMLERQGSFRAFSTIGSQSPFKRQMSLRINDLPSNAERQKAFLTAANTGPMALNTPLRSVSPIPEISPGKGGLNDPEGGGADTVSQLCQELSQGLSLLSQTTDSLMSPTMGVGDDLNFNNNLSINQNIVAAEKHHQQKVIASNSPTMANNTYGYLSRSTSSSVAATSTTSTTAVVTPTAQVLPRMAATGTPVSPTATVTPTTTPTTGLNDAPTHMPLTALPKADQWLGQVVKSASPPPASISRRPPTLTTVGRAATISGAATAGGGGPSDPFDAEWVAGVTKPIGSPDLPASVTGVGPPVPMHSTNPFISPPKATPPQTFQVQL